MKKYLIALLVVITVQFCNNNAMSIYEATMDIISTNVIERFPGHIITDIQPYVTGGLVFIYPTNMFTVPPVISLTISTAIHPNNITYTAEVCVESSTGATVMIYKNSSGIITEALDSEVNVHFTAIGI